MVSRQFRRIAAGGAVLGGTIGALAWCFGKDSKVIPNDFATNFASVT